MDVFYFYIWNQHGFYLSLLIISYIYWVSTMLERADKQALGRQKSKPSFVAFANFHGGDTLTMSRSKQLTWRHGADSQLSSWGSRGLSSPSTPPLLWLGLPVY